MIKKQGPKGV